MRRYVIVAIRMALVTMVVLGLGYPVVVTGTARMMFPGRAEGSLIRRPDGTVVGSALIGQEFESDRYFHGRPSDAGAGYDPTDSGPSNLGPTSRELESRVRSRSAMLRRSEDASGPVPVDLVTSSGSGLDPDITLAGAFLQMRRVAAARGLPLADVRALVERTAQGRRFGFLGEPRVNVLDLNLALDSIGGR